MRLHFLAIFTFLASTASLAIPNPASQNCIDKGGKLEIRKTENGSEYGVCKWGESTDSSECEEWALLRGECKKGDCSLWGVDVNDDGTLNSFCRVYWIDPSAT